MSLLGTVWNRALNKEIQVILSSGGPDYIRITGAIAEKVKLATLQKTRKAFEGGRLFTDADMAKMERLVVKNLMHTSPTDGEPHATIVGEGAGGEYIKGNHVQDDESKQTQAS